MEEEQTHLLYPAIPIPGHPHYGALVRNGHFINKDFSIYEMPTTASHYIFV